MMRTILVLLAAAGLMPAATLTLGNVTVRPEQRADVNLVFRADGAKVSMVQFDLSYDTSLFAVSGKAGAVATAAGKSLTVKDGRYIVMGFNNSEIGDGTLVVLSIAPTQAAGLGNYPLRFLNVSASDPDGKPVTLTAADASIAVQSSGNIPQISAGGIKNNTTNAQEIASGGWVSIYGSFPGTPTRIWAGTDFVGTRLPTELDGVKVYINGKLAYVYFISAGQINVLAPEDPQLGPVPVQVVTPGGSSQSITVDKKLLSPGLFQFDGRNIAAVHLDGQAAVYVGKPDLYPGLSRPAKPGETIAMYGNAFGPTTPGWPDGEVSGAAGAPCAFPVTIKIGGVVANTSFAGLAGVGLYQFNVTVPQGLDGDQPVVIELNGRKSPDGAYINVQK